MAGEKNTLKEIAPAIAIMTGVVVVVALIGRWKTEGIKRISVFRRTDTES